MLQHTRERILLSEQAVAAGGVEAALKQLRRLSLTDFGELLLSLPNESYPALSGVLPRMASVEVQQNWTGNSGRSLLQDTLTFVRVTKMNYEEISGRSLRGANILDYGCGYGRILRLMYFFANPEQLVGIDPWDRSIEVCREDGILGTLAVSDYLPQNLPLGDRTFDLIYSYSVFTHTSLRATRAALAALRKYVAPRGVLVITVRPVEYWDTHYGFEQEKREQLKQDHLDRGFAFEPHNVAAVDGDLTYGDTSIDLDWLAKQIPEWEIRAYDRGLDYYQTLLFLTPR